jgi:biotin carboxylase
MRTAARSVMQHVGFNNSAFNIEFFWDRANDHLWLLEINPRISQSHADLFHKVDGVSNHKITLDVALGRHPRLPIREGPCEVAGKFFVRHFKNGVVRSAPGDEEVRRLKQAVPGIHVNLRAREGQELDNLDYQDSYSYKLAILYFGGDSEEDLRAKFKTARDILGYEIADDDE